MLIELVLRWLHILSAIVLVGGLFFARFALIPCVKTIEDNTAREQFISGIRWRWSKAVMATSGFLLLSGLLNFGRLITSYGNNFEGPYHELFGLKFLLALFVFALAAMANGRSDLAKQIQANETRWLDLCLVVAIALVCVAGYMRSIKRTPIEESPAVSYFVANGDELAH